MSQDSARIALAARIHVALRRKTGRVTDTEWMASNVAYANEVIRLCRAEDTEELTMLAGKMEAAMESLKPRLAKPAASAPAPALAANSVWPESVHQAEAVRERERKVEQRYVGRLR
ncbi:hypothetical protein [Aquabacterium sp.]|uniref:hypothetical protein n=1 Tax=Aquabacterium sp. TaxID=1872578 RepID=UPI0025BC649C|nr:hypothetical protein [Aquabacterium sp.]